MRISDWSSDVFSSDLTRAGSGAGHGQSLHRRDAAFSHLRDSDGPHALFRRRARDRAARLRGHGGARQIPDARRGDRMIQAPDLPLWAAIAVGFFVLRSEEHTSELQSLMSISYAVFCLKKTHNITRTETSRFIK